MELRPAFLHSGERLLCEQRASAAAFLLSCVYGVVDAFFLGAFLTLLFFGAGWAITGALLNVLFLPLVFAGAYTLIVYLRFRVWRISFFRITTERILFRNPVGLRLQGIHTVKWPQYQESHNGGRTAFDYLFFSRSLCVRYGTADAKLELCFPSLFWGGDLKHYLDKVDAAVRSGRVQDVPAFVEAKRGRRGEEMPVRA